MTFAKYLNLFLKGSLGAFLSAMKMSFHSHAN